MFELIKTYTNETGFHITPIEMDGVGLIFLPKELEKQLDYENLSDMVRQSESFVEGVEYLVLKDSHLLEFKNFLNRRNTIPSVCDLKYYRALIVLTESGLCSLLALSRKPNIQWFREWISVEVFNEIKSTGMNMPKMFNVTATFTHGMGFKVTPIEMQGVGFIFLPQELEEQLGYEDLPRSIIQNESFAEGIEYLVLRGDKLRDFKELVNSVRILDSVDKHAPALVVLTEIGFYSVVLASRKPNALIFRRWVTGDILPSIRRGGKFQVAYRTEQTEWMPTANLSAQIQEIAKQQQLSQQTLKGMEQLLGQFVQQSLQNHQEQQQFHERIDTVLAETLPHDMFEGWRKIKGLVEDMTQMYGLSDLERRKYLRELCQIHGVHLPERALLESESLFHDAQELAIKIGVYSINDKPHSRLVVALVSPSRIGSGAVLPKIFGDPPWI